MIKNTNDGRAAWFVCPICNKVLGLKERCPDCGELGVWT